MKRNFIPRVFTVLILMAIILLILVAKDSTEAMADIHIETKPIPFEEMAAHEIDRIYLEWCAEQEAVVSAPYDFISLDDDLQIFLEERCAEYDLDFWLMASLMFSESSFRTKAVGDNGNSVGLFQINKCWWGEMEKKGLDVNEPKDNIEIGLIIFSQYLDKADGDVEKAIQYYKCGPSRGKKLWNQGKKLSVIQSLLDRAEEWSNK